MCQFDINGRIYFSHPKYFGHEAIDQPVNGVYRIDPDGSVNLIIAISPYFYTLYVANSDVNGASSSLVANFMGPTSETSVAILEYSIFPMETFN